MMKTSTHYKDQVSEKHDVVIHNAIALVITLSRWFANKNLITSTTWKFGDNLSSSGDAQCAARYTGIT